MLACAFEGSTCAAVGQGRDKTHQLMNEEVQILLMPSGELDEVRGFCEGRKKSVHDLKRREQPIRTLVVRERRRDQIVEECLKIAEPSGEVGGVGHLVDHVVEDGYAGVEDPRGVGLHDEVEDLLTVSLATVGAEGRGREAISADPHERRGEIISRKKILEVDKEGA